MGVVQVGDFHCGNCPSGTDPGWEFSLVEVFWVSIVRWESSGGQFSGWESSWVGVVQVGIFRVGVFVGGNCSGGTYPRWEFSLVEDLQVGIVRWESSGWYFPGGSFHVTRS